MKNNLKTNLEISQYTKYMNIKSGKKILHTILILLLFVSCNDKAKQQEIADREAKLLEKEKSLASKEADYAFLVKMRDSIYKIQKKDTSYATKKWPAAILSPWTGKVICTESNCTDYVIGDQRIDSWEFTNDETQLLCKIINNNKLIRLYNGKYDGSEINLRYVTDSTESKIVEMNVLLNDIKPNKIKGTRTVTVNNQCIAKFTVELTRP